MAHRPRKRAKSQNARVQWQDSEDKRVLGFAGYKAGMTHVSYVDESDSPTKGQEIVSAATVIEVPPIIAYGVRIYKGKNSVGDLLVSDEKLLKMAGVKKPKDKKVSEEGVESARLLVMALPAKTGIGKKHVEKMEIGCGGKDGKEQLEHCKSMLGKELRFSEVFKSGEYVDIIAVSIGKGWQGPVKRFGVSCQRRKATGVRRHVGTLGQWHPAYVLYTIPMAGQTGYHKRTEYNKRILKVGKDASEVNPKGGFLHYGNIETSYVLVHGSIPGTTKRLIRFRDPVRKGGVDVHAPDLTFVSTSSKQGK